jgi:ABC-type sugar transport system ATPase subunit
MATIALDRISKRFPNGHAAVRDVHLDIGEGELLVLVGPSGSGKSTVLRLIAGLETPSGGRVLVDGHDVTGVRPQHRDLAMVFQSYALYPHKSVRGNLAFGLQVRGMPKAEIETRVRRTAASLDIEALLDRRPAELSGGQRQRVALGRALVREPKAFLLDEPLSNLDPLLRVETRAELARLHRRLRATMVYVTHDQEEAMTLGTRIAVMHRGAVEQVAPPMDLYMRPANVFVAGFIGSPGMNLWRCSAREAADGRVLTAGGFALALTLPAGQPGSPVLLGVRPHDIELVAPGTGDGDGHVEILEPLGATMLAHISLERSPGEQARVIIPSDPRLAVDDRVGLRLGRDRLHVFDEQSGQRLDGWGVSETARAPTAE